MSKLLISERVEIVLLYARQGWTVRQTAAEFNRRHPQRAQEITPSTVGRIMDRFKETGSVCDKPRSGRPKVADDIEVTVLAKVSSSPKKSLKRHSQELGMPRSTCQKVLKKHKYHPYKPKVLHRLYDDDFENRVAMCDWFLGTIYWDQEFLSRVMFSDEANFYVNGEVNKNQRFWSNENPHFHFGINEQGGRRLMVWVGIWGEVLVGPFFFQGTVTGDTYLRMLGNDLVPELHRIGRRPDWFMQDGAPPHYARHVRHWLDQEFPNSWIGRGGPVPWAARSPDLNPLDFFLWGYLKSKVYSTPIRDLDHLQERITEECQNIPREMLRKVQGNMEKRLNLCLNQNGMHFEHLL